MKKFHPVARGSLIFSIFFLLLGYLLSSWLLDRFWLVDAQNRILNPRFYEVEVITADDFARLSDPASRHVTLSDGSQVDKAEIWEKVVLPGYKPTADKKHYILVTTTGTRHVLPYLEPLVIMAATFSIFGLIVSAWNLRRLWQERNVTNS